MALSVSQHQFTFLFPEVTAERADEECIDGDSEEGVNQADSSAKLYLYKNHFVYGGLKTVYFP